jgi:hypothetical protein
LHLRSQAEPVQVTAHAPAHTKWQVEFPVHSPAAFSPSVMVQIELSHDAAPLAPTVSVQLLPPEHEL